MLSNFIPKSSIEWTYLILIVVLLVTLIIFYKGVMKCKHIIEGYNSEIREYKKNLTICRDFITYVEDNNPSLIPEFSVYSDINYKDFYNTINEVNTDNA